jgi:hypothetical protein
MPTLDKLCAQDPEVQPFLIPVDPIALCIPVSLAVLAGTYRQMVVTCLYMLKMNAV